MPACLFAGAGRQAFLEAHDVTNIDESSAQINEMQPGSLLLTCIWFALYLFSTRL